MNVSNKNILVSSRNASGFCSHIVLCLHYCTFVSRTMYKADKSVNLGTQECLFLSFCHHHTHTHTHLHTSTHAHTHPTPSPYFIVKCPYKTEFVKYDTNFCLYNQDQHCIFLKPMVKFSTAVARGSRD